MVFLVPQPSGVFSESGWDEHCAEIVSEKTLCCFWWPGVTSDIQSRFSATLLCQPLYTSILCSAFRAGGNAAFSLLNACAVG